LWPQWAAVGFRDAGLMGRFRLGLVSCEIFLDFAIVVLLFYLTNIFQS